MNKEELELNAKLQQKKNALRKELAEIGVVKTDKVNKFDKYKYFSESGYKRLFTELFSKHKLELTAQNIEFFEFSGTGNQPIGRDVKIEFILHDCETGYNETSVSVGSGIDKGDKAIYKALTGATKYYLANTFLVATGDDAEADSPTTIKQTRTASKPVTKTEPKPTANSPQTAKQTEWLKTLDKEILNVQLQIYKVDSADKLTYGQVNEIYKKVQEVQNG